ncbi:hypothetical protein LJC26_06250 [Desulfovibrio sp. OttesenSCG-928-O18]|nr:hypothetical protein [Desulfovibrio sp. OttesenSCG-928-O18]
MAAEKYDRTVAQLKYIKETLNLEKPEELKAAMEYYGDKYDLGDDNPLIKAVVAFALAPLDPLGIFGEAAGAAAEKKAKEGGRSLRMDILMDRFLED